jgi:hypothetical protein
VINEIRSMLNGLKQIRVSPLSCRLVLANFRAYSQSSWLGVSETMTGCSTTSGQPLTTVMCIVLKTTCACFSIHVLHPALNCVRLNAIADGAIHFYKYHYVTLRVTRYTYGVRSSIKFDKSDPEHQAREDSRQEQYDGTAVLPNAFDILLPKVVSFPSLPLVMSDRWL